jgi:hypothetical protein
VRHCHELGECQPLEEYIVCHFEIGYLKLHVLGVNVSPSSDGHGKSVLADGGHSCSWDYFVERSPTRTQH